jgi:hypothetical protein
VFNFQHEFGEEPAAHIFTDYMKEHDHPDYPFLEKYLPKDVYLYPHDYAAPDPSGLGPFPLPPHGYFATFRSMNPYPIFRIGTHLPVTDIKDFIQSRARIINSLRRHVISRLAPRFPQLFNLSVINKLATKSNDPRDLLPQFKVRDIIHNVLDTRIHNHRKAPVLNTLPFHQYIRANDVPGLSDFIKQLTSMNIPLSGRSRLSLDIPFAETKKGSL